MSAAEAVELFNHAAKRTEEIAVTPAWPPTELDALTEIAMGRGLSHERAFVLALQLRSSNNFGGDAARMFRDASRRVQ